MARPMAKRRLEGIGLVVTGACIALVTVVVLALVVMVAGRGLAPFLSGALSPVAFLTGTTWDLQSLDAAGRPAVGALPLVATSLAVMTLATVFALPVALGSAIFAVEVRPVFGRRVFQPMIELLVGIPSVVFGLIGFHVIVRLVKVLFGAPTGLGILPGAIVLAIMILPTITTFAIDALRSVSPSLRQSALALGCTRWQAIWHVILHTARPSLITATILGMTRAFGETLAVRMVIGGIEQMPSGPLDAASTITTTLTTSMAVYVDGTLQADVLWSLGLLLLAMSLAFILLIHLVGRKGAMGHAR